LRAPKSGSESAGLGMESTRPDSPASLVRAPSLRPGAGGGAGVPPSGHPSAPAGASGFPGAGGSSGSRGSNPAGQTWQERGPHGGPEDRISIPGTHVPPWVVVAIVLGVVALLASTAFFLLR
jgi:hypothetical protein